jgi:hypothetical protein
VGRIDVKSIEKPIGKYMDKQNVLCSDSHPSIVAWASEKQLEHHTFLHPNNTSKTAATMFNM